MKTIAVTQGLTAAPITVAGFFHRISTAWKVASERRALADVDERMLADMGISPEGAAHESARPFWDVPGNR